MNLTITELYEKMHQNMGNSGWWPAESKAEIIIGAIMIQNGEMPIKLLLGFESKLILISIKFFN